MVSKEIYVSLMPVHYKENKAKLLRSQADLLKSLKNLYNLKLISDQKKELKSKLKGRMSGVIQSINSFNEKFPELELPKVVKKEIKERVERKTRTKQEFIDEELKIISEKLQLLNAVEV